MIDKISMIRKELDIQNDSSKNIKLKQELATLLAKDNDFEEALNTITESLNLAQKAKLPKEVNKSLRILIKILQIKNDLALSQRVAKEAIRFFNNYSDNSSIILILNHLYYNVRLLRLRFFRGDRENFELSDTNRSKFLI